MDGLDDEDAVVVVVIWFTTNLALVEELVASLASPEYVAVKWCVPTETEVVNVAVPPESVTGFPIAVPLRKNCTVPVAVDGDTVAVAVTG